jgi:hypothetical protein
MEAETPPITGGYSTSVGEYLRHAPALNRGTKFSNGFAAMAVLLAVLSLPYLVPVALELALAAALVSGYYCVPFTWLTLRSKRALVEQRVEVVADGAGLHFTHAASQIDIPWEEISRLRENRDSFFVMASYPRAYILPKRAFDPAQLEAFRLLAASKGKRGRG